MDKATAILSGQWELLLQCFGWDLAVEVFVRQMKTARWLHYWSFSGESSQCILSSTAEPSLILRPWGNGPKNGLGM